MGGRLGNQVGSALSAILSGFLALLFFVLNVPSCGGIFLLLALIFGGISFSIWYYKQRRNDNARIRVEAEVRAETRQTQATPLLQAPPMTSKGSGRLYVPEPLERYR